MAQCRPEVGERASVFESRRRCCEHRSCFMQQIDAAVTPLGETSGA
jgi:hypothetical protein